MQVLDKLAFSCLHLHGRYEYQNLSSRVAGTLYASIFNFLLGRCARARRLSLRILRKREPTEVGRAENSNSTTRISSWSPILCHHRLPQKVHHITISSQFFHIVDSRPITTLNKGYSIAPFDIKNAYNSFPATLWFNTIHCY